jgi:hypothetical protein
VRGGLLTLACGLMLAGTALAGPPEASVRPQPKPGVGGPVPVLAVVETITTPPRPLQRPSSAVDGPLPVLAVALGVPSSPRPLPRPDMVARATAPDPSLPAAAIVSPRPRSRPVLQPELAAVRVPVAGIILPALARTAPPARPDALGEVLMVAAVLAPARPLGTGIIGRKGSVCGDPAIKGRTIPPIRAKLKGCGLTDGVEITSVSGVALSTPVVTDCTTAGSLKAWVEGAVVPAVGRKGGGVEQLTVAASYVCRPRNNQKGNRISEHGKGRAVDISAIVLADGSAISVERDWGKGKPGKILKAIRAAACGPFSTVLGPGSDRFHRDHLHLDTARGRGAWCR